MAVAEPAAHHANAIRDAVETIACDATDVANGAAFANSTTHLFGAQIADAIAMAVTSWKLHMQTVGATHAGMTYSPCATDARRAGTQLALS